MKKFIIAVCAIAVLALAWYTAYYHFGFFIDFHPKQSPSAFMKVKGKQIYMERSGEEAPFEIRGVDLGSGYPGKWSTDYAIDKETYLRWFRQIQEMGANTIRVYTILHEDFYDAFYTYNQGREEPLYLIHGVWLNDYVANSHRSAYDQGIMQALQEDCKTLVDIIHGEKTLSLGYGYGSGSYRKDISQWVIGYIIGVEWESSLVTYTNQACQGQESYSGTYLYTSADASPFEAMLCRVGDAMIRHESQRYKQQRLVSFCNGPATDPFTYPLMVTAQRAKFACVDMEHIKATDAFLSGMFASYHVFPAYPDYLETGMEIFNDSYDEIDEILGHLQRRILEHRIQQLNAPSITDYLSPEDFTDANGRTNTYLAYLRALNRYHSLPVVIAEYGLSTSRAMAQADKNTQRNQGLLSEENQGREILSMYQDIMEAGCAGSCVYSWQDEWFKRSWNTDHAVDRDKLPYWSDYQSASQFFGLLTFDPGETQSLCYVDGDISEWQDVSPIIDSQDMSVSMMYDEKFLYFLIKKEQLDPEKDVLYIPIDTTQQTGSTYCENYNISFERACDFLIVIAGKSDSCVLVQKRYEALLSTYGVECYGYDPYLDPPDPASPFFERIKLPLDQELLRAGSALPDLSENQYETGILRHGCGNPADPQFDSLADFFISGDYIEMRIPWQLLNFSNPSEMMIHSDYYVNYGVENTPIEGMYVGIGCAEGYGSRIHMGYMPLKGWGKRITFHERLKKSYYIIQDCWAGV